MSENIDDISGWQTTTPFIHYPNFPSIEFLFNPASMSTDNGWAASHPFWCPKCDQINVMKDDLCSNCGWDNRVVTCPTCNREVRTPDIRPIGCILCEYDIERELKQGRDREQELRWKQEHINYDAKAVWEDNEIILDIDSSEQWEDSRTVISIEQAEKLYKSLGKLLRKHAKNKKAL